MLLALDTATRQAGLALYDGEVVRSEAIWNAGVHHTEWMAPAVDEAFRRAGVGAGDLTALAVTIGPGSFTGLRVALSLAKGMAAACELPLIGIGTLEVTAYPYIGERVVCALLQAGRGRHAFAFYELDVATEAVQEPDPAIGTIEEVAAQLTAHEASSIRVVGELSPTERRFLMSALGEKVAIVSPALAVRRPAVLAELGWVRLQNQEIDDLHTLEPVYLNLSSS